MLLAMLEVELGRFSVTDSTLVGSSDAALQFIGLANETNKASPTHPLKSFLVDEQFILFCVIYL